MEHQLYTAKVKTTDILIEFKETILEDDHDITIEIMNPDLTRIAQFSISLSVNVSDVYVTGDVKRGLSDATPRT